MSDIRETSLIDTSGRSHYSKMCCFYETGFDVTHVVVQKFICHSSSVVLLYKRFDGQGSILTPISEQCSKLFHTPTGTKQ